MIRKKLGAEGLSVSLCLGFGFEGLDFVSDALVEFGCQVWPLSPWASSCRLVGHDANHWRDFRYLACCGRRRSRRLPAAIPSSMPGMLAALTYLRGSACWRRSTPCAETSITAPGHLQNTRLVTSARRLADLPVPLPTS